jgi:hypothetical protein
VTVYETTKNNHDTVKDLAMDCFSNSLYFNNSVSVGGSRMANSRMGN